MNTEPAAKDIETKNAVLVRPSTAAVVTEEISEMLMYEELARARIRELHDVARARRTRRARAEGRRWNRPFAIAGRRRS